MQILISHIAYATYLVIGFTLKNFISLVNSYVSFYMQHSSALLRKGSVLQYDKFYASDTTVENKHHLQNV